MALDNPEMRLPSSPWAAELRRLSPREEADFRMPPPAPRLPLRAYGGALATIEEGPERSSLADSMDNILDRIGEVPPPPPRDDGGRCGGGERGKRRIPPPPPRKDVRRGGGDRRRKQGQGDGRHGHSERILRERRSRSRTPATKDDNPRAVVRAPSEHSQWALKQHNSSSLALWCQTQTQDPRHRDALLGESCPMLQWHNSSRPCQTSRPRDPQQQDSPLWDSCPALCNQARSPLDNDNTSSVTVNFPRQDLGAQACLRNESSRRSLADRRKFFNIDSSGCCIYHPHVRLRKKKLFGGWKSLLGACPDCCLEGLNQLKTGMGSTEDFEFSQERKPFKVAHKGRGENPLKGVVRNGGKLNMFRTIATEKGNASCDDTASTATATTGTLSASLPRRPWEAAGGNLGASSNTRTTREETTDHDEPNASYGSVQYGEASDPVGQGKSSGNLGTSYDSWTTRTEAADPNKLIASHGRRQSGGDVANGRESRRRSKSTSAVQENSRAIVKSDGQWNWKDELATGGRNGPAAAEGSPASMPPPAKPANKENREEGGRRARVRDMEYVDAKGRRGRYSGEVDETGLPRGRGIMMYEDGMRREGRWKNGRRRRPKGGEGRERSRRPDPSKQSGSATRSAAESPLRPKSAPRSKRQELCSKSAHYPSRRETRENERAMVRRDGGSPWNWGDELRDEDGGSRPVSKSQSRNRMECVDKERKKYSSRSERAPVKAPVDKGRGMLPKSQQNPGKEPRIEGRDSGPVSKSPSPSLNHTAPANKERKKSSSGRRRRSCDYERGERRRARVREMEYNNVDSRRGLYTGSVDEDYFPYGGGVMAYLDGEPKRGRRKNGKLQQPEGEGDERRRGFGRSKSMSALGRVRVWATRGTLRGD